MNGNLAGPHGCTKGHKAQLASDLLLRAPTQGAGLPRALPRDAETLGGGRKVLNGHSGGGGCCRAAGVARLTGLRPRAVASASLGLSCLICKSRQWTPRPQ